MILSSVFVLSQVGSVRAANEDAALVNQQFVRDGILEIPEAITLIDWVFVADGMGGQGDGALASKVVLNFLAERGREIVSSEAENVAARTRNLLEEVHQELLSGQHSQKHLGTTLCGVIRHCSGQLYLVNVGDSRLYRFRNGFLMQLSTDHSLREATGNTDIADNILLSSLGGGSTYLETQIVDISKRVSHGDCLILCSDGLYKELSPDDIENTLGELGREKEALEKLVKDAIQQGGHDNITIAICSLKMKESGQGDSKHE
jgi:protein phosphatase